MAILLIVFSTFIHQLESVFIKKYNSKHKQGGFIFTGLISLFAMVFFVITDKNGLSFPSEMLPYAIISGIFYCDASFLTYVALGCGSYVMTNLILSYSLIFPVTYGIVLLKEPASFWTYIGFAIMIISLYLVRGAKEESGNRFSPKWLISILLSAVGSGMFSVIMRVQQIRFDNSCTNEFMIATLGFSAVVLLLAGIIRDGKNPVYILKNGSLYAIGAGLSNGATNMLSLVVNMLIPISIASPVKTGIKIVLSFILSKLIFKEKFLKRQIVGVILGALALVFLNI